MKQVIVGISLLLFAYMVVGAVDHQEEQPIRSTKVYMYK